MPTHAFGHPDSCDVHPALAELAWSDVFRAKICRVQILKCKKTRDIGSCACDEAA